MHTDESNLFDWIDEHEDVFMSDKDPLPIACKYIMMNFIFMDRDQFIRSAVKQKYVLPIPATTAFPPLTTTDDDGLGNSDGNNDSNGSKNKSRVIPNSTLIRIIETQRGQFDIPGHSRYKLADIALFHVPATGIRQYSTSNSWWKILSSIEDVVLPPSLYFFQNAHCLWVFFQETVRVAAPAITYSMVGPTTATNTETTTSKNDLYNPDKLAMLNKHLQTRRRNLRLVSKQHTRRHIMQKQKD